MSVFFQKVAAFVSKRRVLFRYAVIALVLICLYAYNASLYPADFRDVSLVWPDALQVHFADIGQGDAALLLFPDGKTMLIDAGTNESETALLALLDDYGIDTLDYAVFTHPHEDHIGGADRVLKSCDIKNVILSPAEEQSSTYDRMIDAIKDNGSTVYTAKAGDDYSIGEATLTLLGPIAFEEENQNNASVVLRLDFREVSFLFTGDAELSAEQTMLESFGAEMLDVDVLKVGHHGSSTSSSANFLDAVTPRIAVISCGENNDYGHPHTEVLTALHEHNAQIFRTDLNGNIRVYTDGKTFRVLTENN